MVNILGAVNDFRKGLIVIFGKPKEGEGDRKLARMAIMIEGMIQAYGKDKDNVRRQVIKIIGKQGFSGNIKNRELKGKRFYEPNKKLKI